MSRLTVLPLALLGFGAPAWAAEPSGIDDLTTTELGADDVRPDLDATRNKAGAKGRPSGKSAAARPSAGRGSTSRSSGASRPSTGPSHASPAPSPSGASRPSAGPSHAPSGSSERTIVHTTPGRPGNTVVHTTPNRPGRTVVHHGPGGPVVAHTAVRPGAPVRPGPPVRPVGPTVHHTVVRPVVHHVSYTHVYPYHGVFVYGPRPVTHVHYVNETGPVQVKRADLPKREIDRNESLAVGLKGGSLISGTESGPYADPGLGLAARYRPAESVGLELALTHHGQTVDPLNSRSQTQVAGSVELFAYPWTRVSPYVLGGVTMNSASIADDVWTGESYTSTASKGGQLGLHGGLGLELALGKSAAIDLEGRYIGWMTPSALEVETAPGALQATAGLMVHFK